MIKIKNLVKRYKGENRNVLDSINIELPEVGLVFLIGDSGAGKTTLASIIGGMDNDFKGSVISFGKKLEQMNQNELSDYRSQNVGFSFQGGYLDLESTVYEEIKKPLITVKYENKKINELLKYFEMSKLKNKKIKFLSGGERKRVSIIKSLIKKSKIIILDEPTAGLNSSIAKKAMDYFKELSKESLIIMITHDLDYVKGNDYIKLKDGKLIESKINTNKTNINHNNLKKHKITKRFVNTFLLSFKSFSRNLKRIGPSCFAMAISITISGFSSMLVSGINDGFNNISSSTLNALSVMGTLKQNKEEVYKKEYLTKDDLNEMVNFTSKPILYVGTRYMNDVNDIFTSDSGFYIEASSWKFPKHFGLNLISKFTLLKDYPVINFYPDVSKDVELLDKEVFLGMPLSQLTDLMKRMNCSGNYEILKDKLNKNLIKLSINAKVDGVQQEKKKTLQVKAIYIADEIEIRHTNPMFAEIFFESNLGCVSTYNYDSIDPLPYTIKKAGIVYVDKNKIGSFYRSFILSKEYHGKTIVKLDYDEKANSVPFAFIYNKTNQIKANDVKEIYYDELYNVNSYSYSSTIYQYVSSGLYEGFSTPLFISNEKEGLNQIADHNLYTEDNLQGYSFATDDLPDNVEISCLTNSVLGNGVKFISPSDEKIIEGKFPSTDKEIAISKGLAMSLFKKSTNIVGKNLNLLMLDEVKIDNGIYKNSFAEATLRISSIIDNDEKALYHDPLFPVVFTFIYTDFALENISFDKFILQFLNEQERDETIELLRDKYPDYIFTIPLKNMVDSLNVTLSKVGKGLSIFGIISILLSGFLLFLTIYLTVKKDEKKIGELLAIGMKKSEISFYYLTYSIFIGLLSVLQSAIGLFFARKIAINQLSESFGGYTVNINNSSFILIFVIAIVTSSIIGVAISNKTNKITPVNAFRLWTGI